MSWYRYSDGEAPLYRLPLTLDGNGASGNWTFSLAGIKDLDEFWNGVQSANGYDIRVTEADGSTLIAPTAWDILSFNATTRTGTIRVQGYTSASGMCLLWLYWGKPSGDATSVWVGSPSPTSPRSCYLDRTDPGKLEASRVVRAGRTAGRATKPLQEIRKEVNESVRVYFLFDGLKRGKLTISQGVDDFDGPTTGAHTVVDENGTDASTMYTSTEGRFAVDSEGALYYGGLIKAGTNATKYTARVLFATEEGETLQYTCGVVVRNTLAS